MSSGAASGRRLDWVAPVLALLAIAAWCVLWRWDVHVHGPHQVTASSGTLFAGAWTMMTVAMMLPTTLPLVNLFRRMTSGRSDSAWLTGLLVLGYLATWVTVGVVSWIALHATRAIAVEPLEVSPGLGNAALLLIAGAFQFSSLKYRCLEQCRSPRSFLMGHWRGGGARRDAVALGLRHGLFCVGCCWALMLLMFVAGVNGLAWMVGLGAIMAVEKNTSWGARFVAPVGTVLMIGGVAVLVLDVAS